MSKSIAPPAMRTPLLIRNGKDGNGRLGDDSSPENQLLSGNQSFFVIVAILPETAFFSKFAFKKAEMGSERRTPGKVHLAKCRSRKEKGPFPGGKGPFIQE